MFYYIKGGLTVSTPSLAVVEAAGVGYSMTISETTYRSLPRPALTAPPEVLLYTYLSVRENDIELFGFRDERELLRPRQPLHRPLAAHRLRLVRVLLKPDELHGQAAAGIFSAAAGLVGAHAGFEVVGPAGVKCSIAAFHDVSEIFRMFLHLTALPAHLPPVSMRP